MLLFSFIFKGYCIINFILDVVIILIIIFFFVIYGDSFLLFVILYSIVRNIFMYLIFYLFNFFRKSEIIGLKV